MRTKRKFDIQLFGFFVLVIIPGLLSVKFVLQEQPEPWEVPKEYKKMKNPVKADTISIKAGKLLYEKHCASCHGKSGLGNGIVALNLETFPGDMTGDDYQSQTDGEQFYKTKFGRGEMPKYENKIADEDIWHMVNYMRTFKEK